MRVNEVGVNGKLSSFGSIGAPYIPPRGKDIDNPKQLCFSLFAALICVQISRVDYTAERPVRSPWDVIIDRRIGKEFGRRSRERIGGDH